MARKNELEVVGSKMYPSKAMLTKLTYKCPPKHLDFILYVRENARDGKQILELCAPAEHFEYIQKIISVEDSVGREVLASPEFTVEWAEAELAKKDEA